MADDQNRELWHTIFGVGHPKLQGYQRFNKRLPSPPRCRMCLAPFKGAGGLLMRMTKRAPSNRNPRFCSKCDQFIRAFPGGAEVEMSMVFADVRGSTTLAEKLSPTEFGKLINQFYAAATKVFVETDGFMIDVVGDEVFALYPPGFSGPDHANLALDAARELVQMSTGEAGAEGILPFGAGVHTDTVYIGTVEGAEEGIADVRVMGDGVNTAALLCSAAQPGEALVSDSACAASGLDASGLEHRDMDLKGKTVSIGVHVLRA